MGEAAPRAGGGVAVVAAAASSAAENDGSSFSSKQGGGGPQQPQQKQPPSVMQQQQGQQKNTADTTASTSTSTHNNSSSSSDEEQQQQNHAIEESHAEQQQQQQQQQRTALEWKEEGNAAFSNKNYRQALAAYQQGLALIEQNSSNSNQNNNNVHDDDNDEEELLLKVNLQANCAMALIRLHEFRAAEQVCTSIILSSDENNKKDDDDDAKKKTTTTSKKNQQTTTRTPSPAVVPPKIWYRRALSREGQALALLSSSSSNNNNNSSQQAARDLLGKAKSDLQRALHIVEDDSSNTSTFPLKERQSLKRTVATLAHQIQGHLKDIETTTTTRQKSSSRQGERAQTSPAHHHHTSNGGSSVAVAVVTPPPPNNNNLHYPEPSQQRQDLVRLLLARQMGLQQQHHHHHEPQQAGATAAAAAAFPGEAFCLVDSHWWKRFCDFVDLFYTQKSKNNNNGNQQKNGGKNGDEKKKKTGTTTTTELLPIQRKLLGYLPPGAILPQIYNDQNDDDSSDSDSEDDNGDYGNRIVFPPGPIDNSRLLLLPPRPPSRPGAEVGENGNSSTCCKTREIFLRHWYRQQQQNAMDFSSLSLSSNENNPDDGSSSTTTTTNGGNQRKYALSPSLVRGYHYEILPREIYNALRQWYGEVTPSLCRRATSNNDGGSTASSMVVPLYPNVSSMDLFLSSDQPPPQEHCCNACRAPRVGLRCTRCSVVYYCDRMCQESHWPVHKNECKTIQEYKQQLAEKLKELPAGTSLPPIRLPMANGRVGLNNLGNTCFMNSALQCLSHATPLTRLFLSGNFRLDVNQTNPLGTGGKLAHAYEAVMKDLWMRDAFGASSGRRKSTSPIALKRAISLFAPRFAGHLQHDAQEFLAYLLDGLHEDLNRIRNAPYVEMPDVTNGQNMHVAGARAWDAHRRRNDSLVMDTFYGQFKSTCVCPRCNRVSVSFESFNHISLEIPQQNAIIPIGILLFRAPSPDGTTPMTPVRYAVQMRRTNPFADLKEELSKLCGIPASHLQLCRVAGQEITNIYRDNHLVSEIRNTLTVAYEAEPFQNAGFESFHALVKHKIVTPAMTSAIAEAEENTDEAALAAAVGTTTDDDFVGLPLLTSFPADSTCRQVWQHFFELLRDKLPDEATDHPEDRVQLRIHNGRNMPIPRFPNVNAIVAEATMEEVEGEAQEKKEKPALTSLIPKDLDEPFVRYLGQAAIDNFLSVWIEWIDNTDEDNDSGESNGCGIDVRRFSTCQVHSSWIEAEERQRTIKAHRGVTLDQCFETFTKPERLDERNEWYCSRCKEHVRAMKTMELWRLPNVLIVHLKRFEFKNVLRRDKLDTLVDFPLEGLDMSIHCAADKDKNFVDQTVPAVYDLFAVTNHFGRMGFGHYTAFAREWSEDGISDDWALFDDSSVRSVGDGTDGVVSPAAYVLFYRRRTWT